MPVAPHLNSEVRLVLSGTKPLATVEKRKDALGYALAVSLSRVGMLWLQVIPASVDSPEGEAVFTLPHNRHLIQEYIELLSTGVSTYGIKEYHRKMGRMFGYTEKDIDDFINSSIHCECSKCRGA